MSSDPDSFGVHYAVIEAIRTQAPPELFVISYRNEKSLRLLIADFCIVATGFTSREAALELCAGRMHFAA